MYQIRAITKESRYFIVLLCSKKIVKSCTLSYLLNYLFDCVMRLPRNTIFIDSNTTKIRADMHINSAIKIITFSGK